MKIKCNIEGLTPAWMFYSHDYILADDDFDLGI
jgi:hypothetical protein